MKYKKLSGEERGEIGILHEKGYSARSIAKQLDRSHNTISYELLKNSTYGVYQAIKAQTKARTRLKKGRQGWNKIEQHHEIKQCIIEGLKNHWNPDEISGDRKMQRLSYVSKTTIYKWLRTVKGKPYCAFLYSKRTYVKKRSYQTKREMISNKVSISERKQAINDRTECGHYERDTIVGKKGTPGGLATAVERKTRLVIATKVATMSATEHVNRILQDMKKYLTKSIMYDNGIENKQHAFTGIDSYFCDPYSSWQKGSIENANKMIRRYFPKGADFTTVTTVALNKAISLINNKPRKILGYQSALALAQKERIILTEGVLIGG